MRVGGGVGAGVVIGGELFVGDQFAAGEIGHVVVDDEGALCKCGKRGCLEAVVSVPLLAQRLKRRRRARPSHAISSSPDAISASCWRRWSARSTSPRSSCPGRWIFSTTASVSAAIDTIRNRTFPNVGQHVSVRFSSLGDDGVLLGAAALVLRNELGIV